MISMHDVTGIIQMFISFNTKGDATIECEQSDYNDEYFRWTNKSFSHGESLTAIYNESAIYVFDTSKVKDRLLGNMDKVKSDKAKVNFGCNYGIVEDLVFKIPIRKISEKEISEYKKNKKNE